MKVVIIGGVAGGATAAARLRRLDEHAEIVVLERGGFVSYANCGLPYYVGGSITDKEDLTLQTPQSFWRRFRIDVRVHNEALAIHPEQKTVTVKRLDSGEVYEESYDKLVLSPGASPVRPPLPGIDHGRVLTLRSVEDSYRIRDLVTQQQPQRAVVVGGGFIGLEMAENLREMGLEVTLVEALNQVMAPLDYDMACLVHAYLKKQGVGLRLGKGVAGFEECCGAIVTQLSGGDCVESDLVVLAIGVAPDTKLAKEAGITLGVKGSIVTNDRMETNLPDVYAVGDAVEVEHVVTGQRSLISLAGPANKQGRIAADNICGRASRFKGAQGSSVLKLFDMTVACTGVNERAAKAAGMPCEAVELFPASHATYYPGARNMNLKVVFNPDTGKVLGAQIVGFQGVDKRIDVLAAAIRAGADAADLTELELAYAPPYSSAKDPVNMAGYMIEDVLSGLVKQFHWDQVADLPRDGSVTLLDVRTPKEYGRGKIEGFVNLPLDELRERLEEVDPAKPVYIHCQSGLRSYLACRILAQRGYDCYNLSGGYQFWSAVQAGQFDTAPAHPCGVKI